MEACIPTSPAVPECADGTEAPRAFRVCFVCTGNTCRSPMAEAVANELAERELDALRQALPESMRGLVSSRVEACSAGLYPNEGEPIAPNAAEALARAGVRALPSRDYRKHRATALTEELADNCDLLVGMSYGHAMEMLLRYPQAAQRITAMPHAISDPYGGDLARYEACLAEITEGVKAILLEWESNDGKKT